MHIHAFTCENDRARYILYDENEAIIDLPTRFAYALASRIRYSKRSVIEYLKVLKLFCEYVSLRDSGNQNTMDETIASMGPVIIEDWFLKLRDEGISGATLRTRDVILKAFMEWLTTQEAGQVRQPLDHPYSDGRLKTATPSRPAPKYLTYQEVATYIQHGLRNESERCLAHFMYDTGARVSEVPRVLQADLPDLEAYSFETMYFPLLIRGSKGRGGLLRERYTIISRPLLERLYRLHNNWRVYLRAQANYPADKMPAFLNVLGQPITASAIQKQTYKASVRLNKDGLMSKHITPHCFRHGTAFSILQSEHGREFLENLVVCQRALGHVSIKTTELYTMIPAPIIARMQQFGSPHGFRERYQEAQYIYEQSFKPQRDHTEHRGHGPHVITKRH
ncbi:hypothetical protein GCM10027346_37490 [Hymenobacter seoulensis]